MIYNLACSQQLCPRLRQQVEASIMVFVDPSKNDLNRAITAMQIIELINPDNTICEYRYPDNLFRALSSLLSRVYYCPEETVYRVCMKADNQGTIIGADAVLICLKVLCKNSHYRCKVMGTVKDRIARTGEYLKTSGDPVSFEKRHTQKILETLSTHECQLCPGRQYANQILQQYGSIKPSPPTPSGIPPLDVTGAKGQSSDSEEPDNAEDIQERV